MVSCSGSSTLSTYAVMSVMSMAYPSSHSLVGAHGDGGVVVYPWCPGPVTSGRSRSRDARYSAGPLLASWVGWWRRGALDRCVQGARSQAGGRGGAFCGPGWPGSAGLLVAGSGSGGVRSICCSVSSVCWSSTSSRLSTSRAKGSSWACWGAASWFGGCVMLVLGVCAAAGAGPCAGARGSAWFGVVVVCACSLVAVPAGGVAPGPWFGLWLVVGVELACGVWGFQGRCWLRGGGVRSRRGVASFLCWLAVVFHVLGWGRRVRCGMVVLGCVVAFLVGRGGRVQVWWGGWSLVAGPRAVWGGPVRSPGCPSGVFQYVGRVGSLWCGAWGPLGRGVWDWSVAPGGCGRVVLGCVVLCMGHTRAATFAGSAGRYVAASWACCGPGAASVGGEWWCVAGVYRLHGGGGAVGLGVGWVRGRLPAGSGCRGLTVGGSSAVSPWCVLWWPLVGWLRGVLGVYRIHGGTTVRWCAVVGCGVGACVGVVCVVGGGVSCVVLGCSSWWSVVAVRGGWSWAWRFLGGHRTCVVGTVWGGRVCVWVRVFALCSLCGFFLSLSLALPLFVRVGVFFLGGEGACGCAFSALSVGVGVCRCRCWCGCGCREGWVADAL